eukprot:EG_transcript_15125
MPNVCGLWRASVPPDAEGQRREAMAAAAELRRAALTHAAQQRQGALANAMEQRRIALAEAAEQRRQALQKSLSWRSALPTGDGPRGPPAPDPAPALVPTAVLVPPTASTEAADDEEAMLQLALQLSLKDAAEDEAVRQALELSLAEPAASQDDEDADLQHALQLSLPLQPTPEPKSHPADLAPTAPLTPGQYTTARQATPSSSPAAPTGDVPGGALPVNGVAFPPGSPHEVLEDPVCEICMTRRRSAAILDCGHAQFCLTCLRDYVQRAPAPSPPCPLCQSPITRVIRIHL